jgi:hypothetical protein
MPTRITDLPEYTTITSSAFVPIVDSVSPSNKNKKITIGDIRKLYFTSTTSTSAFTKHTPGFYYFGDNRDAVGMFTGSITTVRTLVSSSFASTVDGPALIKNFTSLFISKSVICKPTNRCKGMVVFVDGDATISGSLSMTQRGASATGTDASFYPVNPPYLGDYWTPRLFPSSSYLSRVFSVGAGGGTGAPSPQIDGLTGVGGRSGGGGAGSSYGAPSSAAGGTGTSFSGGAGGGGAALGSPVTGGTGSPIGGAGGAGRVPYGGGGAGNPGGASGGGSAQAGGSGTGGLLILIVRGNLKIGPNGSIDSNGSNGGNANSPVTGGGGGGSGGGIIYVYYGGTLTNYGSITATGGAAGTGGNTAGNGGAGSITTQKLNTIYPISN